MEFNPCYDPRERDLLPADHDIDEPISFMSISEKVSPEDVIWCFSVLPDEYRSIKRHFAVDCAERVRHLMRDKRSLNALAVARRHAFGDASDDELMVAMAAARAAVEAAGSTARAAAWAARAAWEAWEAAEREEVRWQVDRIIELAETGEWSPVE